MLFVTRLVRTASALAVALGTLGFAAAMPAEACGGLFCQRTPVDQAGERILFATDGETVTAYVQIQYQGSAENFSWIVPVPTAPKLSVGSDALFTTMRNTTRPSFQIDIEDEGDCRKRPQSETMASAPRSAGATSVKGPGVGVVSQEQIGAFDAVVLEADDAEALKKWLRDNDYQIPAKVDPLLDPYVAGKYKFVALKLTNKATAGDIQPIVMKYAATKPGIPIRLTGVAATPDMDVYVWTLGKERSVPENYRHAVINEARIDWLGQGSNYRTVVTAAMNESGGQAFVTDYAGKSAAVDLSVIPEVKADLSAMQQIADPVAFAAAVREANLLPPGSVTGFLARYIKKPDALEDVPDETFYASLAQYEAELKAEQIVADGAKGAEELMERYVTPGKEARALFQKFPYLTALYTTMSPDEMNQDPMFVFNPDMGDQSAQHRARGVRKCSNDYYYGDAPIEVTLANGVKYMLSPNSPPDGSTRVTMPAAARIEQLKNQGGASVIKDNKADIMSVLGAVAAGGAVAINAAGVAVRVEPARAGGFGCLGCSARTAPPIAEGSGEFVAYGLMAAGFIGYRRRLGRTRR